MPPSRAKGDTWFFHLALVASVSLVFIVSLCISDKVFGQGLRLAPSALSPAFLDDFDRQSLLLAAKRQAAYLQGLPKNSHYSFAGRTTTPAQLLTSIRYFIKLIEKTPSNQDLSKIIHDTFTIYQAAGKTGGEFFGQMLVTGYYEPLFAGSLQRQSPFLYPLYAPPADLINKKSRHGQKTLVGRRKDGVFRAYWTRAEIETGNILAGNELIYLKDPFEAFLLHVQGSGKIQLRDGSIRAVCYAGSNGHPYRSIGKVLIDEKKMTKEEATLPAIEAYLRGHSADMTRILHSNPRFIFFRWGDDNGPRGSNNIPLTAGRSIAIDQQVLPPGTIAFLTSRRPVFAQDGRLIKWIPMQRFVFPQDSGAAIQGAGRVDLFLGDSHEAGLMAGLMKEEGALYFLLKK